MGKLDQVYPVIAETYTGLDEKGEVVYGFRFEHSGEYAKMRYILNMMLSAPPLASTPALHALIHKLQSEYFKDSKMFDKCCEEKK